MAIKKRASLKNYFLKGSIPKESEFNDLIDSTINQADDGLEKPAGEAIKVRAEGKNEELIRFFKNMDDKEPTWKFSQVTENGNEGFAVSEGEGDSRLFVEKGGNVGIGVSKPQSKLHVDGFVGMNGRIGFYAHGEVAADGNWHNIVTGLNDYNAFEIIAVMGKKGAHAITHAVAVRAYGKSHGGITKTQSYFGKCRNKIDFRWTGEYFDYQLQVRTKRNLGEGVFINYNVTKLF
ncbi:MAG: adhesin [Bacteroidetes bacterium]|nr:adhesin [Bacteroidota bacterium]MBU1719994.1 adhesin [Bacteroidota bacterium]